MSIQERIAAAKAGLSGAQTETNEKPIEERIAAAKTGLAGAAETQKTALNTYLAQQEVDPRLSYGMGVKQEQRAANAQAERAWQEAQEQAQRQYGNEGRKSGRTSAQEYRVNQLQGIVDQYKNAWQATEDEQRAYSDAVTRLPQAQENLRRAKMTQVERQVEDINKRIDELKAAGWKRDSEGMVSEYVNQDEIDRLSRERDTLRGEASPLLDERIGKTLKSGAESYESMLGSAYGFGMEQLDAAEQKRQGRELDELVRSAEGVVKELQAKYDAASGVEKSELARQLRAASDNYRSLKQQQEENASRENGGTRIRDRADFMQSLAAKDLERAKLDAGKAGSLLIDAAVGAEQMGLDLVLGGGASAMVPMMVRSFGGGVEEARQKGYNTAQQLGLGLASAAIEYFSEKLFGGNPVYDSEVGLLDNIIYKIAGDSRLLQALASAPAEKLYEGFEEIVSDLLNPIAERIIAGTPIEYDWSEVINSGIVGVLTALVAEGGQQIINAPANARAARAEAQQAAQQDAWAQLKALAEQVRTESEQLTPPVAQQAAENVASEATIPPAAETARSAKNEAENAAAESLKTLQEQTERTARADSVKGAEDIRAAAALDFGKAGQEAINYDGSTTPGAYYRAFSAYYRAGINNSDIGSVTQNAAAELSEQQRQAAYEAGQTDAAISLEREKANASKAEVADAEHVMDAATELYFRKTYGKRKFNRVVEIAKRFGNTLTIQDRVRGGTANAEISGSRIEMERANTLVVPEWVKNPEMFVIGHEITHRMQELAPEAYWAYRDFVSSNLDTAVDRAIREYRAAGEAVRYEQALDEAAADYAGKLLEDGKLMDRFIAENKGNRPLLQKLLEIVQKIKDFFNRNDPDYQFVRDAEEKLLNAMQKASWQAEENRQNKTAPAESESETNYSLKTVDPVQPSSDAWQRGHDEAWFIQNGYPIYRDVTEEQAAANQETGQEKRGGKHGTQIQSTQSTYRQVYERIKAEHPDDWQDLRILDASSGLGLGTRIGREDGFNVTDIEPFPSADKYQFDNKRDNEAAWEARHPDYTDYSQLEDMVESGEIEGFDYIISNAVLNVIPQDTRDNLTVAMGHLLKPGGKMFVNVISRNYAGAVDSAADIQYNAKGVPVGAVRTAEGDYSQGGNNVGRGHETFVWKTNTVQKVFSYNELTNYLQDALGPEYSVKAFKDFGMTAAVVTKNAETRYSLKTLASSAGLEARQENGRVVLYDSNGKKVDHVTARTIDRSGIGALINYAATSTDSRPAVISQDDAVKQKEAAADLMNMIIKAQDGELVWRFAGSALFSAVKSNSDGQYGTTIDFSTVCRKTQEMMTAMSKAMVDLGRGLTKAEVIELQKKILEEGGTVPCPVCYVFSRWAGVGGILDNMMKWQEKYGHDYDDPAKLAARMAELEEATKTKKGLRAHLQANDALYQDLKAEQESLQAEKKQQKALLRKLQKAGNTEGAAEIQAQLKTIDERLAVVGKDIAAIEANGASELAWLKRVRSQEGYWEKGAVPADVLFNLDDAATFAEKYPLAWGYRTSRGPSAGKAILPYADMRLGDMILGTKNNSAAGNTAFANVENGEFSKEQTAAIDRAVKRTLAQNLIGGQRFQSTSDFRYDYALDYLQVFWEAQALGSKMQTYTKIVEFAEFAASVGGDVNLSVMPLDRGYDDNGRLQFSSVTGMNIEAASKANAMFDNVQLILVGINDEHIRLALRDSSETGGDLIGFVIPYHASGASINTFIRGLVSNLGESFNEDYYQDYSDVQNDAVISNGADEARRRELRQKILRGTGELTEEEIDFIRGANANIRRRSFEELREIERRALRGDKAALREYESWSAGVLWDIYQKMRVDASATDTYGVKLNSKQAEHIMPHEYWNKTVDREHAYINGFIFRSYCHSLGLAPRFSGIDSSGKRVSHGDFTDEAGYWKTLIDRPMYANDGTYREQQRINVTDVSKEMLTPEYGERNWDGYKVAEPSDVIARTAAEKFVAEKQENRASLKTYDELGEEYGLIPEGERPWRPSNTPRRTAKNNKVSQTARTIIEAKATPDVMVPKLKDLVEKGTFSYTPYSDEAAIADAEATVTKKGYAKALADWTTEVRSGVVSKANTALGWALYNAAANEGDTSGALSILTDIVGHQRNGAQAVQATRILKRMEPSAQLYAAVRSVESLQEDLNKKYGEGKAPELKINEELAARYLAAPTEKERSEVMAEIYRDIGQQMPSSFTDRFRAWRYLAMLGNARTHVRNIVGNAGFMPVVALRDVTATGLEALVSQVSGGKIERNRANILNKEGMELFKAAFSDFKRAADERESNDIKYNDYAVMNRYVEEGRKVFGNTRFEAWNKTGGAALEAARHGNSKLLGAEDTVFKVPYYAVAMAQYAKAHGITAEQIRSGKGLDEARAFAYQRALENTYNDANAFSDMVSRLGRSGKSDIGSKAIGVVTEGILPFKRTPANILVRALEYSPLGLMKSISYDLVQVKKGKMSAAEMIEDLASGLTGTGLVALGALLASFGIARGSGGDDEKKKKFEDLEGHQGYSLELPDGTSVTLDWLAPEALPFFIGVNLYENTVRENEAVTMSEILSSVSQVTEPLLEMSCLQSLNDLFDNLSYASDNELSKLWTVLASAGTSYLTQAFPTLGGQAERTAEDKRMQTYTEKNAFLTGDMQYTLGKVSAKVPGWDFQQIPYIDAWGREELTGKPLKRAFSNFLNPAYVSKVDESEMEQELMRLYEQTGENVFPQRPNKYITVDGERKYLAADEYVTYATQRGQIAYQTVTSLIGSDSYQRMTDEEKADAVSNAYDLADQSAKVAVGGAITKTWVTKAATARSAGIQTADYIAAKTVTSGIESLKDKNGETITNSKGLLIMQAVYNNVKGLTPKQYELLFEDLGVGKTVRDYSQKQVESELAKMRVK